MSTTRRVTTHGDYRMFRGLPAACSGGVDTIPVPHGYDPETVVTELRIMGRLMEPPTSETDCTWATVRCPGDDWCWCRTVDLGPNFKAYEGDVQVYP